MKKAIITLIMSVAFVTLYSQTSTSKKIVWKKITKDAYSMSYPSTWEAKDDANKQASFIIYAPMDAKNDQFKENINLIVGANKNISLDEYVKISISEIKKGIKSAVFTTNEKAKNINGEYYKMIYTGELRGGHYKWEQYYFMINNTVYVLTFTSEESKFANYQKLTETILNSFTVKK